MSCKITRTSGIAESQVRKTRKSTLINRSRKQIINDNSKIRVQEHPFQNCIRKYKKNKKKHKKTKKQKTERKKRKVKDNDKTMGLKNNIISTI